MMKLGIGLRSALLALAMVLAMPTLANDDVKQASAKNTQPTTLATSDSFLAFVAQHPVMFIAVPIWFIIDTRLNTRKTEKKPFSMQDLRQDFTDLLDSLHIFDSKLYKQLLFLFDKYIIGLPLKLEEAKTDTKDSEGQRVLIKGKKLIQKPFGAYGLFDAYVLRRAKKFTTEVIAGAALLYLYFNYPGRMLASEVADKGKSLNITIAY